MTTTPIHDYIQSLEKELAAGNTTEHSHRPALKTLFQSLNSAITATNEPQHITAVGAPDFRIIKNKLPIGYVECKDIGKNLDEVLETEQLKRYLKSFHNLLLTDYLEFRWYVGGKLRLQKTLGTILKNKIKQDKDSLQEAEEILTSFLNNEPEPIGSPKELAGHMARLAHMIREIIIKALKQELVTGSLHAQWQAFRENLIPELSVEQFADMYAQTIAYGLFAARCETDNVKDFTRQQAAYLIPKTNPFLRKLFNYIAGPDLDESITWAVDDLSQILAWADMEAVLKNFGKSTGKSDPVVHFYETFLKEYDPKTREMRGVYYTPLPVVSYIVRSIDYILKTSFDKPQGLADPGVLVLDPAVGTATFLYMVMQEIHDAVIKQGQTGTWDNYVTEKLLPRLFGFELLMAPYAIAHLKLGRLLKETGYQFQTDQRLGIYLTNTLEEAVKHSDTMFAQWITEEANAAADIKKTKPIMVVLGNPPYSGISANDSVRTITDKKTGKLKHELTWIGELIENYKIIDGKPLNERKHWLQDDYVKFIRFGQWRINKTGSGVLAFITNNGYLDGATFRGMRQSLMNTFTDIYILNLHGNSKKKEFSPDGGKDENVFDIQQGVTIGIFIKEAGKERLGKVHYADMWGLREGKYQTLFEVAVNDIVWKELIPNTPFYFFLPRDEELKSEYEKWLKISEISPINSTGIVTARDGVVVDFNNKELTDKIAEFANPSLSDDDLRLKYFGNKAEGQYSPGDTRGWKLPEARNKLQGQQNFSEYIRNFLYRPFDLRRIYYTNYMVDWPRPEVMYHMQAGKNIGLQVTRQTRDQWDVFVTRNILGHKSLSAYDITSLIPLYIYPAEGEMQFGESRRPNLNSEFVKAFSEKLGMKFQPHSPALSPSTERGVGDVSPSTIMTTGVGTSPSPFTERELEGEVSWRTSPQLWEKLKPLARQMRKEPTKAEDLLWQRLRNHQLSGFKFRRQHSIERFIVDFYCSEAKLVIEIDGPIHQYHEEEDAVRQSFIESQGLRLLRFSNDEVNINLDKVMQEISDATCSPSPFTERESESEVLTPEDIFNYAYAVFHSPEYRSRYAEFLKIDFPRLPLTSDKALFKSLAEKGAALVSLHLLESPLLNTKITKYEVKGDHAVDKVSYDEKTHRVSINKTQYFEGVPPEVWNFHIGGYQVCEKWLKDRQKAHRKLTIDDIDHYQKIVVALKETIRLMSEIDEVIVEHGGWPGAFQ